MSETQGERTFVNDVQVRTVSSRRISMTINSPVWTLADVREFVDFAIASGAIWDDRVFFGTFHAEISRNPLDELVSHVPPRAGQ